jgi:hypothetical protein
MWTSSKPVNSADRLAYIADIKPFTLEGGITIDVTYNSFESARETWPEKITKPRASGVKLNNNKNTCSVSYQHSVHEVSDVIAGSSFVEYM